MGDEVVRLQQLQRCMANFVGEVLSVKDPGIHRIDSSSSDFAVVEPTLCGKTLARRKSLAQLYLDVGAYMPNMQDQFNRCELEEILHRITLTQRLEFSVMQSRNSDNLCRLAPFLKNELFVKSISIQISEKMRVRIGAMGSKLVKYVKNGCDDDEANYTISKWLTDTTAVLFQCGAVEVAIDDYLSTIERLSDHLARRITRFDQRPLPDLDELIKEAQGRHAADDITDVQLFAVLLKIARDGCAPCSENFLKSVLRKAFTEYPEDFVGRGINADMSDFPTLLKTIDWEGADFETKLRDWQKTDAGSYAEVVFSEILWQLTARKRFPLEKSILTRDSTPGPDLPEGDFGSPISGYRLLPGRISGLRVNECLDLIVCDLLFRHNSFEPGVVPKAAVEAAYYEGAQDAAKAKNFLQKMLAPLQIGLPLVFLLKQVLDRSSFNYSSIRRAMLHLTHFSIDEIKQGFGAWSTTAVTNSSDSFILSNSFHGRQFQDLVAQSLTVPLPRDHQGRVYSGFALDGLKLGLVLLQNERTACGIAPCSSSNLFCDLVNTADVKKCCLWRQFFCITKNALCTAHPNLKMLLEHMAASKMIEFKRPRGFTAFVYLIPQEMLKT